MNKRKVTKDASHIKLVLNGVPEGTFDIENILSSLELNYKAFCITMMREVMNSVIESEVIALAGAHHERTEAHRWSSAPGYVVAGGAKVKVQRPRLRDKATKKEIELSSYKKFQEDGPWHESVMNRMIAGVSVRKYEKTVEEFAGTYGISKSTISRKTMKGTAEKLKELLERSLANIDVVVLAIDEVFVGKTVQIVALGIDFSGNKHVLGFRQGATENATVTLELVCELAERGLNTSKPMLVLVDGSKALHSGLKRFFGIHGIFQRCQLHKLRNVCEHLPQNYHAHFARQLTAAYSMKTYDDAKAALIRIVVELDKLNESAANSLREGMEETLTVHRLGLPDILRKSLSSTNIIESSFSVGRTVMHNVKRWTTNDQVHRYLGTALLEAESNFCKVNGHRSMSVLIAAMDQDVVKINLDSQINVA